MFRYKGKKIIQRIIIGNYEEEQAHLKMKTVIKIKHNAQS